MSRRPPLDRPSDARLDRRRADARLEMRDPGRSSRGRDAARSHVRGADPARSTDARRQGDHVAAALGHRSHGSSDRRNHGDHGGPATRGERLDLRERRTADARRPGRSTGGRDDREMREMRGTRGTREARGLREIDEPTMVEVRDVRARRTPPRDRRDTPDIRRRRPTRIRQTVGADERRTLQKRVVKVRTARHHFKAGQHPRRLRVVFALSALVFAIIIGRVVLLQTTDAEQLREAGRAQRTSDTVLRANRGVIFDRNGDELALSVPSTTIIANPKLVTDPAGTVDALNKALTLTPEKQQSLLESFTTKEKSFVYVARQVTDEQAATVRQLDITGIDLIAEDRRAMPAGAVGQSVIGKTNIDGEGIAGLEMQYDDILTGVNGEMSRQHDRDGRSLPGSETTTVAPVPGQDIVLTIDRSVQFEVERALVDQVTNMAARGGSAIVMDTDTGEIIAMVGVRRGEDGIVRVTSGNIAAVDAAEPGSVVKAITIAAALNEGTVTPDTVFHVPYRKNYSDDTLHDAEVHDDYDWPVTQILAKSSNIGTIEVMLTMGETMRENKEKLGAYMRAFGLGEKTALDFPGESRGLGVDWTKWEGTEQYTVAYGQGIASTSIQLVSAINVIANDGVYVAPKLVGATIDSAGVLTDTPASGTHRVVRPEVAQQVNLMMRQVVCEGTAKLAQVDGVTVAGKTGTGLKAQDGGGYEDADGNRKYYSSFAGFFPAEDPQVTVLISIDEPPGAVGEDKPTHFGGTAAAPVFADIAPAILHEMNITPPATGGCPKG